jgi:hypothetical protein
MLRPESPRSRFGKPNFILGWIASVDSEISIIDLFGVDYRKLREKESKQNPTNPVHTQNQPLNSRVHGAHLAHQFT